MSFLKTAKSEILETVAVAACPICSSVTTHVYYMQDAESKERSKWYNCSCGVTWSLGDPKEPYNRAYYERYKTGGKKYESAVKHLIRVYLPIIEESMYGREVLEVGHTNPYQVEEFAERGWIPYSIDKNTGLEASDRLIVDDFETHDFGDKKFNLIWMVDTLECFKDPAKALSKCLGLLTEDGILFLSTPDTDFINTRSSSGFVHWKPTMNRLMWSSRALTSYLEKLGFNIIVSRRNYEHRFAAQDVVHLTVQRKFF